jgi:O-antigen/teichoic acid export membrane protein
MMLGSGFARILHQMDILVGGSFIGTAASGIYSVADRFANLVNFGLQISNQSTAHMYTPLYVNGQKQKLQRVVSLTVLIAVITTVPIVAALFTWLNQTLALFGEAFSEQGAIILQFLLFGQFVHVVSGPNGLLMQMTNYQNEMALIQLATLVFDAALLVALVPTFGLLGAAIAAASATVFRNLVITVRVQRHLGINPTAFSRHLLRG